MKDINKQINLINKQYQYENNTAYLAILFALLPFLTVFSLIVIDKYFNIDIEFHINKILIIIISIPIILGIYNKTFINPFLKIDIYYDIQRNIIKYKHEKSILYMNKLNNNIANIIFRYSKPNQELNDLNIIENKVRIREGYPIRLNF